MKRYLLFVVSLFLTVGTMAQNRCSIRGVVVDRPQSKTLLVAPLYCDFRAVDPLVVKVAEDGTFDCTIDFCDSEIYAITFKDEYVSGSWRPTLFMLESGTVEFVLNPKECHEDNKIVGGELNKQFLYIYREIVSEYKPETERLLTQLIDVLGESAYSSEYRSCLDSLSIKSISQDEKTKIYRRLNYLRSEDKMYGAEGRAVNQELTNVSQKIESKTLNVIKRRVNEASLARLYMYVYSIRSQSDPSKSELYRDLFNRHYAKRYAQSPMAKEIAEIFDAMEVKVGSGFVDFEAPDLDGNMHKLSELIEGKVVVLNLWASWCGPCMRTSTSFIPIWDKYHDRGFDIVGVARESNNTKAMVAAIDRLGFKWLNLVELNDRAKIWSKYGAGNSGGKVILIDREGKIVATDFVAEELEDHLERIL